MTRAAAWALVLAGCATDPGGRLAFPPPRVSTRGELVLHCVPDDADVLLDGVPQGTCGDFDGTKGALGLGLTERRVEVNKGGFRPWEAQLTADGTRMVVNVTLIPTEGSTP